MLEIKYIRQNIQEIKTALINRGDSTDLEIFTKNDEKRRSILLETEELRHRRNIVSDQIAQMKKKGEDAEAFVIEMREVSNKIKQLEKDLIVNEDIVNHILIRLPNIPHSSVPIGKDEASNVVLKTIGSPPTFSFQPDPHWTIGEKLHIFDFSRAARIAGARFPLYMGAGARMERALINFMLDIHTLEHGYTEILPPLS